MSKSIDKLLPVGSMIARGLIVVAVVIGMVTLYYKIFWVNPVQKNPKLMDLEKTLQEIRAAMNVDSIRQYNIQKVMSIIEKYNTEMPSSMKYEIAEEIYNMSVKYTNLDIDLISATITQASGGSWDPEVVSESGAMGLMQIMPTTGLWVAYYENITWTSTQEILFNPIYNIRIGCRRLSALINNYELEGGLAAFSGGEKRAAVWLSNDKADGILLAETTNFIPHVMSLYEEYKTISL
ncbi:MAG: lytic transglycosylase domain-containing protein [bacterium]